MRYIKVAMRPLGYEMTERPFRVYEMTKRPLGYTKMTKRCRDDID